MVQTIKPRDLPGLFRAMDAELRSRSYKDEMGLIAAALRDDHRGFFLRRSDPSGRQWAPLSPVTVRRKGHDKPLILTREMMDSTVQAGAEHIENTGPRTLTFGTANWKAPIHQDGTKKIPARPFIGWSPPMIDFAANTIANAAAARLGD